MQQVFFLFFIFLFSGLSAQNKVILYFDSDEYTLNSKSKNEFNNWLLSANTKEIIKIEGYCDRTASSAYNKILGSKRAKSVEDILVQNKIPRLSTCAVFSFGEDFKRSQIHARNRKVVVYYQNLTSSIFKSQKQMDTIFKEKEVVVDKEHKTITLVEIPLAAKIKASKVGDLIPIQNLNFKFNSEIVVENSAAILTELGEIMRSQSNLKIEIHGHICCNPDPNDVKLSNRRAKSVHDYLIKSGIQQSKLSYKGFGSNKPLFILPEKNEKERAANRRVEILIVQK